MAYADQTYYTSTYLGEVIPASSFNKLAMRASKYIDRLTFNRAVSEVDPVKVDAIKMAMCAVADELYEYEQASGQLIHSESVGDHSVTYAEGSRAQQHITLRIREAMAMYLDDTGLMYPGFYGNEQGSVVPDWPPA